MSQRFLGIALILILVGCSSDRSNTTAAEAPIPAGESPTQLGDQAASTITAPGAPQVLARAVLGGPKSAWVAANGVPVKDASGERFGRDTDVVSWWTDAAGEERATHVELTFPRAVPLAQARRAARALHPPDARPVRDYVARAGQHVEVFHSALLAQAFASASTVLRHAVFGSEAPGTYIQIAERGSPTTRRVLIATGDNP